MKQFILILLLTGLIPLSLLAQPAPSAETLDFAQTMERLMVLAGYPDSVRARLASQDISRLEAAMLLNQVMVDIEEAGVSLDPDLLAAVQKLSLALRDEIALLELKHRVDRQQQQLDSLWPSLKRPQLLARLRFYAERQDGDLPVSQQESDFYGPPPKKTKVLLAQELVVAARATISSNSEAQLELRNFGYWGVGKYSSGSTGIGFSTAGPLFIDQAWVNFKTKGLSACLGRQKLKFGSQGLLVEHRYSPILGLLLSKNSDPEASVLMASQFEGLEYYALRTRKKLGPLKLGAQFFFSDYTDSQKEMLGIQNDQGAGIDLQANPWGLSWGIEYGFYKPHPYPPFFKGWHPGWVASGDIVHNAHWRIYLNLGRLSTSFTPNLPPVDRFVQDYPAAEFNRIIYGTQGANLTISKHWTKLKIETEASGLDYLQSDQYLVKLTLRAVWDITEDIKILLEDFISHRAGKKYNQAGILLTFSL